MSMLRTYLVPGILSVAVQTWFAKALESAVVAGNVNKQYVTGGLSVVTYCLLTLPATTALSSALANQVCTATDSIPGTKYVRSMLITTPNTEEVDVTVTVGWTDGGKSHQSQSTLILKKWL